jgi:hypothetical protein
VLLATQRGAGSRHLRPTPLPRSRSDSHWLDSAPPRVVLWDPVLPARERPDWGKVDMAATCSGCAMGAVPRSRRRGAPHERDGIVTWHFDRTRVDTATIVRPTDLRRSLDEPLADLAGHLSVDHAVSFSRAAQVAGLLMFRHDPGHTDTELESLRDEAQSPWAGPRPPVLAAEGTTLRVEQAEVSIHPPAEAAEPLAMTERRAPGEPPACRRRRTALVPRAVASSTVNRLPRGRFSSHSLVSARVVVDRDLRCRSLPGRTRARSQSCEMPAAVAAASTSTSDAVA